MDNKTHSLRREHWRKIIFECNNRDPGITKRDWCRSKGICVKSLYYWQRQFRSKAVSSIETAVAVQNETSPAFLDITEKFSSCQEKGPVVSTSSGPLIPELMIQTGNCQIYVSGAIQERTLETVIKVLNHHA